MLAMTGTLNLGTAGLKPASSRRHRAFTESPCTRDYCSSRIRSNVRLHCGVHIEYMLGLNTVYIECILEECEHLNVSIKLWVEAGVFSQTCSQAGRVERSPAVL